MRTTTSRIGARDDDHLVRRPATVMLLVMLVLTGCSGSAASATPTDTGTATVTPTPAVVEAPTATATQAVVPGGRIAFIWTASGRLSLGWIFLDGPALKPGDHDRYFEPDQAGESAPLFEHAPS